MGVAKGKQERVGKGEEGGGGGEKEEGGGGEEDKGKNIHTYINYILLQIQK